jgi:hypothetical protein
MTTRRDSSLRAELERLQTARRSARAKTAEVLGRALSELSERALLQRQRAARNAIEEALGKGHGRARDARDIAFHLSEWFEEAAFLVALHLDPNRFSKTEIKAGVSDVSAYVLDHMWEAARVAGVPLPCLEDEALDRDGDEHP